MTKFKKITAAVLTSMMLLSVTAFAEQISSSRFDSSRKESPTKVLGAGTHYLNGRSVNGYGIGYAKRSVTLSPDVNETHVILSNTNSIGKSSFNAASGKSYYIYYSPGSSSTSADLSISH